MAQIVCFGEDALVEREPGQLAVDEAVGNVGDGEARLVLVTGLRRGRLRAGLPDRGLRLPP